MDIENNVSLKQFNTFGVNVISEYFVRIKSLESLLTLFSNPNTSDKNFIVLGGGSNILFTDNFKGLIIKNEIVGINVVEEDEQYVWITSGAGEVWHDLVKWTVDRNYGGIENLSLIPGSVGAGPIQNIGAYGVEIKDVFQSLHAFDVKSKKVLKFSKDDCNFGYRNSIFKNALKNKVIITSVTLKLSKNPSINIQYGSLKDYIASNNISNLTVKTVSDAICAIRSIKLPDPKVLGNAGSFFKNPVIGRSQFNTLKGEYPEIVGFPISEYEIKVAAGWLIESCGWKGKRVGETGSHAKQALVLVNYGNANGKEIFALSEEIINSVKKKYNIELEREVNVL